MRAMFLMMVFVLTVGCNGSLCENATLGGPFCVPDSGVAPAGQKITVQIIESCGGGCTNTGTVLACAVARDGGHIELSLAGMLCSPPPGMACPDICRVNRFSCELPPLEEGDYTITSSGQGADAEGARRRRGGSMYGGGLLMRGLVLMVGRARRRLHGLRQPRADSLPAAVRSCTATLF